MRTPPFGPDQGPGWTSPWLTRVGHVAAVTAWLAGDLDVPFWRPLILPGRDDPLDAHVAYAWPYAWPAPWTGQPFVYVAQVAVVLGAPVAVGPAVSRPTHVLGGVDLERDM